MNTTSQRAMMTCLVLTAFAILFLMTREHTARCAPELLARAYAEDGVPEDGAPEDGVPKDNAPQPKGPELTGKARNAPAARDVPPGGVVVTLLEKESRKPIVGAHWRVDRYGQSAVGGVSDADGTILLSATAVNAWERSRLRIWAEGRRDEQARMPKNARGTTVEITLAKFHVDFAGRVLDDAGRPIEGARVVISYWNVSSSIHDNPGDLFRTKTDSQGKFRLSAKVWHPDIEGLDGHVLLAGAPGFIPLRLNPDKRGEDGLDLRLVRDRVGGVLEIQALLPDGTPARDGDFWFDGLPQYDTAKWFAELVGREGESTQSLLLRHDGERKRILRRGTWKTIGGRDTWWGRLSANGSFTLHPVPPGARRLQILAGGYAADVMVNVVSPPTVSQIRVQLEPLRTVTGTLRVAKDPNWHCDHETHKHVILYDDWPEPAEPRTVKSGPFRLNDLPPGVTSMRVVTDGHPDVVVALPSKGSSSIGDVLVLTAREITGTLRWPKGCKPEPWSQVRLVDREGTVSETTTYYTSSVAPQFRFVLTRRPAPDAWIVVRLRMSDGDRSPVVRLDGPFNFVPGRPLDLTLPSSVTARGN